VHSAGGRTSTVLIALWDRDFALDVNLGTCFCEDGKWIELAQDRVQ
jgi:hypothetical protein